MFTTINSFSSSILNTTKIDLYASGLLWSSYSNNTTFINTSYENAISFTTASTHIISNSTTNTLKNINYNSDSSGNLIAEVGNIFNFSSSGNTGTLGDNIGLAISGYFLPNQSGVWSFQLGSPSFSNDDISAFWFNETSPSSTNISLKTTFRTSDNGLAAYTFTTPTLTEGVYYPINLNWGQSAGGSILYLNFTNPSGQLFTDGTGFFLNKI